MLVLKNIVKDYVTGDTTVRALNDVSINFRENEFVSILGPSGCGKTTLLNVCAGVFKAEEGVVLLDGADAFDNSKERKEMFYLTDDTWFPAKNSVLSSAKYYAEYFPNFDFDVLQEVCDLFGLNSKANIKSLSKGMKKQAGLAIAFAASPKYLLIDETFDGLVLTIFLWFLSCMESHTPSISSKSTGISFFPSDWSAFICLTV